MAQDAFDHRGLVDEGDDSHLLVALRAQKRVGFPDFQDEFAPPLGGGSAELVCGDVDVLLEYYIRSSSMMN
jgi:hypothetical protein